MLALHRCEISTGSNLRRIIPSILNLNQLEDDNTGARKARESNLSKKYGL